METVLGGILRVRAFQVLTLQERRHISSLTLTTSCCSNMNTVNVPKASFQPHISACRSALVQEYPLRHVRKDVATRVFSPDKLDATPPSLMFWHAQPCIPSTSSHEILARNSPKDTLLKPRVETLNKRGKAKFQHKKLHVLHHRVMDSIRNHELLQKNERLLLVIHDDMASVALLQVLVDLRPIWSWEIVVAISREPGTGRDLTTGLETPNESNSRRPASSNQPQQAVDTVNGEPQLSNYMNIAQLLAMRAGLPVVPGIIQTPSSNLQPSSTSNQGSTYQAAATEHGCTAVVLAHTATDHAAVLLAKMFSGWPAKTVTQHSLLEFPWTAWIQHDTSPLSTPVKQRKHQIMSRQQFATRSNLTGLPDCDHQQDGQEGQVSGSRSQHAGPKRQIMKTVQPFLETPSDQVHTFFHDCVLPKLHEDAVLFHIDNSSSEHRQPDMGITRNDSHPCTAPKSPPDGLSLVQNTDGEAAWNDLQWHYDNYLLQVHNTGGHDLASMSTPANEQPYANRSEFILNAHFCGASAQTQAVDVKHGTLTALQALNEHVQRGPSVVDPNVHFIRHEVLPVLRQHFNPCIDVVLTRTARILQAHAQCHEDLQLGRITSSTWRSSRGHNRPGRRALVSANQNLPPHSQSTTRPQVAEHHTTAYQVAEQDTTAFHNPGDVLSNVKRRPACMPVLDDGHEVEMLRTSVHQQQHQQQQQQEREAYPSVVQEVLEVIMDRLQALLPDFVDKGSHLLVAVSGGQDSMCMLWMLRKAAKTYNMSVTAAHFDHQWRHDSTANAQHVASVCKEWGIPCYTFTASSKVDVSTENAARKWRYDVLAKLSAVLGCSAVLTGHTQTDKVETALLNLARGSGPKGLDSLKPRRLIKRQESGYGDMCITTHSVSRAGRKGRKQLLHPGLHVLRPMLSISRQQTGEVCRILQLPVWHDSTNDDMTIARRNRVRHQLVPLIESHFGKPAIENILRSAASVKVHDSIVDAAMQQSLRTALADVTDSAGTVDWPEKVRATVQGSVLCNGGTCDHGSCHCETVDDGNKHKPSCQLLLSDQGVYRTRGKMNFSRGKPCNRLQVPSVVNIKGLCKGLCGPVALDRRATACEPLAVQRKLAAQFLGSIEGGNAGNTFDKVEDVLRLLRAPNRARSRTLGQVTVDSLLRSKNGRLVKLGRHCKAAFHEADAWRHVSLNINAFVYGDYVYLELETPNIVLA